MAIDTNLSAQLKVGHGYWYFSGGDGNDDEDQEEETEHVIELVLPYCLSTENHIHVCSQWWAIAQFQQYHDTNHAA